MNTTETLEGETLDAVLYRVYGYVNESLLDQVSKLNQELSEYGAVFPLGVTIKLPEKPASAAVPTIHLWD